MKKILALLIIFLFPLFFSSCWKSQEEPEPTLELEESIITVDALGGDKKVGVTSNTRWKLNYTRRDSLIVPVWYIGSTVTDTVGTGSGSMTLTVAPNPINEQEQFLPREATLTIEMFDEYAAPISRTLTVRQEADYYRISVDREEITVNAAADKQIINVESNGPWEVDVPDGITYTVDRVDKNKYTFSYPENTTAEERRFIITFTITKTPYPEATVTIIQRAGTGEEPEDPEE